MSDCVTPLGFSQVDEGCYRSAYPTQACLGFIETLNLKTVIALQPEDLRAELRDFCAKSNITIIEADIGLNQEPFLVMSEANVNKVLDVVLNPTCLPVMIFCNNGRLRTSCLVGCFRRTKKW